jgi:outer membrane lipoprotein LolB
MHLLPAVTSKVTGLSIACLGISSMLLTGCQSVQATTKPITAKPVATVMTTPVVNTQTTTAPSTTSTEQAAASTLPSAQFTINGKIGMTTPQQAGSAFYIWTQQGQNFAIEIAGAIAGFRVDNRVHGPRFG